MVVSTKKPLLNYINGEWCASQGTELLDVVNPATTEVLSQVPLSEKADVELAVTAAAAAFTTWRRTPPTNRVQYLFKLKILLEEHLEDLSETITQECGKTLVESKAELRRAIENVEVACGIP
ncbi:MAG: aldehyde dehydrogenase family protein, partial [Symploca sp. SIO1A3]|nr:aldehyde dehydrogenase family protein [Symploca sp. SIO1A3]